MMDKMYTMDVKSNSFRKKSAGFAIE